ncbi:MAG: hypothetical protein M1292_01975 [Bacteroidetes bacterium]|nr:hypothetical protein [Bacteroidota bacterium]
MYWSKNLSLSLVGLLFVFTFCSKKDTLKSVPALLTSAVTEITSSGATTGGKILSDGGGNISAAGVCWSIAQNPTIADKKTTDELVSGSFTSNITGLDPVVIYYVRAYATNSAGTAYGNQVVVTTPGRLPTVVLTAVSSVLGKTAISGGNVTSEGGALVVSRGVCWSETPNPTTSNDKTSDGYGKGVFVSELTDLVPNTVYHLRAFAMNSIGTAYSNEISFTTAKVSLPVVLSASAKDITANSVTLGGNVTSDGNDIVSERGVVYATSQNPTLANSKYPMGTGPGVFSSNVTGISSKTTYYVRAYATNSVGTVYGSQLGFTTP